MFKLSQKRKTTPTSPLVLLIIIIIGCGFVIYALHSFTNIYQISFSDDGTIVSDGAGPYPVVPGVSTTEDSVRFSGVLPLSAQIRYSTRTVKINFNATQWEDENLAFTSPRLPTDSYRIELSFYFNGTDYTKLQVGESLIPSEISINLVDKNDANNILPWTIDRSGDASIPVGYVPSRLYGEGHAYLTRESEDLWILDVDGWFKAQTYIRPYVWGTYYLRLSFKINLEFRSII
jgi:hypothetical protein